MPRRPRFIHPLRAVRGALEKSQPEFAKMFGVSVSYLQKIEAGQRRINDELADAIMLRLGVDAASLKAKHGTPKFLLDSPKVTFFHGGLRVPDTPLTRRVIKDFDQRKTLKNQNELWRASFSFWRHIILSAWKHDHARIHDTLKRKLDLLLQAAERENKYHAVTLNLTRWIDAQVRHYHLRTTINALSKQHTGRDADWPSFKDTLPESFQRKEKRTTR